MRKKKHAEAQFQFHEIPDVFREGGGEGQTDR